MKKTTFIIALTLLQGCFHADKEPIEDGQLDPVSEYRLNDTGMTSRLDETVDAEGNSSFFFVDSASSTLSGQDADHGRDISNSDSTDGHAGFSFTKLDITGNELVAQEDDYQTTPWHCVHDNVTGLTWEVKHNTGLQNSIHRFTWYDTDSLTNGGNSGAIGDSSTCGGELNSCNTQMYTAAINTLNSTGLCNHSDWRLPTREELRSLIHYGKEKGSQMIDTNYFPFSAPTDHWTSQTALYADFNGSMAWEVHFEGGHSEAHAKQSAHIAVRLVRGPVQK